MPKKILIIAGGGKKHLAPFAEEAQKLNIDVKTASFSDLNYDSDGKKDGTLFVNETAISAFDLIYVRVVGKRQEDLSLLIDEARKKNIRVVDRVLIESGHARLPVSKLLEARVLANAEVPIPRTIFDRLSRISQKAPEELGYPFVIKSTLGKQGHGVWSPRNKEELDDLVNELLPEEKLGRRFIAQEFIKASERTRVFVIGDKAVAGFVRPMRWRRRFVKKINGQIPEARREGIRKVKKEDAKIAVSAATALGIEIAGVDLIHEDESGKPYIMEVNSAPRWDSIKKDTGVNVEKEILEYLISS